MLQFIAQTNDRYSVAETVQMAIEGGCRWIQLHLPELSDEDIKAMSGDIIDLCRESAAFLTIEDRPELAKELSLHGVHLTSASNRSATKLREELGPEAVIGVEVASAAAIMALRNADIDYVTLPADMAAGEIAEIVSVVRDAEITTPIVATGNITPEDALVYMAAGVSGIATGKPIIEAKDPVKEVELMLQTLSDNK
ncbi:MAG: thiamine phosphate synthase [Muribaculaceae bacterium]|nr:thiamine phosphate synthase [Muribaculaceae bacterium]